MSSTLSLPRTRRGPSTAVTKRRAPPSLTAPRSLRAALPPSSPAPPRPNNPFGTLLSQAGDK